MRLLFLLPTLAAVLCVSTAKAEDQLLFLGNHDIPPMIYMTGSGVEGVVVDLAEAIIERAELNASVDAIDWQDAQSRLADGSADALLNINSNPVRERIYDFSEPLLRSQFAIFKRSGQAQLRDLESLGGRYVGVEKKGYPSQLLDGHPDIQKVILPDWAVGFQRLSNGELDAIVVDRWVGEFELSKLHISNVVVEDVPVSTSYSAIAVSKGNKELLKKINEGIRAIKADGTYDQILQSWSKYEVYYLTSEDRYRYLFFFLLLLLSVILVGGWIYFKRINTEKMRTQEMADRLAAANEELLNFSYRASHDLKSPLVSIHRLTDCIIEDIDDNQIEQARSDLQRIRSQVDSLSQTITDILDLHRSGFESGTEEQPFRLADVVQTAVHKMTHLYDDSSCSIQIGSVPDIELEGGRIRYQQIIENLLSNAIKYRDEAKGSTYVNLEVSEPGTRIHIKVEDNGLGIPSEYQSDAMGMFKRFHPAVTEGSGLGLAIVKKHVSALGGQISFSSTEQGTVFDVSIPKVVAA